MISWIFEAATECDWLDLTPVIEEKVFVLMELAAAMIDALNA